MGKEPAMHKYQSHGDHRSAGQTHHEYSHSTACGYVREAVTTDDSKVTCNLCRRKMAKPHNAGFAGLTRRHETSTRCSNR